MPDYILKALFVLTGLLLLRQLIALLVHAENPIVRFFLHAVMGLCVLLLGNTVGSLFGLGLGLNTVTVPIAAGLGVSGVALLWLLRYLI